MDTNITLKQLKIGKTATVISVGGEGALRQHFLDMGLIPGVEVTLVKYAPMGDPMELRIHSYELTLRLADAEQIEIANVRDSRPCEMDLSRKSNLECMREKCPRDGDYNYSGLFNHCNECNKCATTSTKAKEHPGLGEGGRFHQKSDGEPLPEGERLSFALVGNQNCGKTTLFNALTGSNQHVGNFPGVTVDRKDGEIKGKKNTVITDLPGIYSMSPYTSEEQVSRQFILDEKPKAIINIVDATNIERNLYLTMQLMEMDRPMVLALNMMDEVKGNGGVIRVNELEELLGIPVVPISAAKNEGIGELVDHAIHIAKYNEKPGRQDFCGAEDHGGAVHRCLHGIMHLIEDHAEISGVPLRFAAAKLVEGDSTIADMLHITDNEKEAIEHLIIQMEDERGLDRAAAIAEMRFGFISKICRSTVIKSAETKEHIRSRRWDEILTGKYTAIPAFIAIMGIIFYLTFNVIGLFLQEWTAKLIDGLGALVQSGMEAANVNNVIQSLIIDGVFTGVGSVVSFLPIIVTLFFFLSLLEDSGYMARVAFFMDKLLRKMGLSGRSIVPMLIGFGCSVPSIMASRTLPSERDRKLTIIMTPFMSCSAKLPIYAFFTAAFFPGHGGLIMIGLYVLGIVMGILVALLLKYTKFRGEAVPFVMELPNYRMPGAANVGRLLWDKSKDFLQRAFTVIFFATLIIWFLHTFDLHMNVVSDSQNSILAVISGWIAPIFSPMGFGDWRISTALVTGFIAKESVVATIAVLFGAKATIATVLTPLSALALLVFCLLYTPCVAAIASVKNELGSKWAIIICIGQCALAWLVAFAVFIVGSFVL